MSPSARNENSSTPADALPARVLENVQRLLEAQRRDEAPRTWAERIASRLGALPARPGFALFHVAWFGTWVLWNAGPFATPRFDPFPFSLLSLLVCLESVLLLSLVLVNQGQLDRAAEERAKLDLHVNLLVEHETTKLLRLVGALARRAGVELDDDGETRELAENTDPLEILHTIRDHEEHGAASDESAGKPGGA